MPTNISRGGRILADVRLPGGTSVNNELVNDDRWYRKYASGSTTLEGLEVAARDVRIPGYCGRHEFPPVETLRGFSLLISFAPPLRPSYAVAFLLVAHGGVVEHEIEEVAEQEL